MQTMGQSPLSQCVHYARSIFLVMGFVTYVLLTGLVMGTQQR